MLGSQQQLGAVSSRLLVLGSARRSNPVLTITETDAAVPPAAKHELENALASLADERVPRLFHTVEEALVRAAFAKSGQNQVHTARLLGITRNSVRTLLKRYGLLPAAAPNADAMLPH